jgi:hypothetical protein
MKKSELERCAYHESGRIVFAYLAGYTCNSLAISSQDSGNGNSVLNGGSDNAFIQKILNNQPAQNFGPPQKAYAVAAKLALIYCAGSCARVFFENDGSVNEETEIDFPGQDTTPIEQIQRFMMQCNSNHPQNYIGQVIAHIFQRLAQVDIWKSVSMLAQQALSEHDKPLTRYKIEDTLMGSGLKLEHVNNTTGFQIDISETNDKPANETPIKQDAVKSSPLADIVDESPLDIVLKNYLQKLKPDLNGESIATVATHLKTIFQKYADK